MIKTILARFNRYFVTVLLMALLWGQLLITTNSKGHIERLLNKHHTVVYDNLFKYTTDLGNGVVFAIFGVAMLFVAYGRVLGIVVAILTQTLLVQVPKRWLLADWPRPKVFFGDEFAQLHTVAGVDIHSYNSFPSGHTATAFTMAILLAYFYPWKTGGLHWLALAVLVAISRVYLLQHFVFDVAFGAIIGVLASFFALFIYQKYFVKGVWEKKLKSPFSAK